MNVKYLITCFVLGIIITYFFGRKRQIGVLWSLFFCTVLNPIIGFIIIMLSRKYYDDNPPRSSNTIMFGSIFQAFGGLSTVGLTIKLLSEEVPHQEARVSALFFGIGLFGLGIYLKAVGKGKNFNSKALTTL